MPQLRRAIAWLYTAAVCLVATPAWACPYCVGREKDVVSSSIVIASMVCLPLVIAGVASVFIRRASKPAGESMPEMTPRDVGGVS